MYVYVYIYIVYMYIYTMCIALFRCPANSLPERPPIPARLPPLAQNSQSGTHKTVKDSAHIRQSRTT